MASCNFVCTLKFSNYKKVSEYHYSVILYFIYLRRLDVSKPLWYSPKGLLETLSRLPRIYFSLALFVYVWLSTKRGLV